MSFVEKWPRSKALKIREILERISVCGCGTAAHWQCVFDLLTEAENNSNDRLSEKGFYRDQWFEWGAKVLDKWGLLEHGTGIGWAWLTDDGKMVLEFLRDFGLAEGCVTDDVGHPMWSYEFGWDEKEEPKDSYSEWMKAQPAPPTATCPKETTK